MDLLATARRLAKPFVFPDEGAFRSLPLAARGIIGDGFTAGLVAADGAIDWLCLPRFDSPSVFARVLDYDRGGSFAIRPASRPFQSLQAYDGETNVLETLFVADGHGRARLVDAMPWSGDPRSSLHELHRRLDCVGGKVDIEVVFDPRFGYGHDVPKIEIGERGVIAIGAGGEHLTLSVSPRLEWTKLPTGGVRATFTLRPGSTMWSVLSWGSKEIDHVATHRPWDHLRATRRAWRQWASKMSYDGRWRNSVLRSALALKLLMYAPTGAVVAAPTTSFPEWIGGDRNWDYRYNWARDSAMAVRATNLIGFGDEARDFYHFLRDAVDTSQGLALMYTIDGRKVPEEVVLQHLSGALGSSPVRIGNGARDQIQLDTTGAVVDAAHLFDHFGGSLTRAAWRKLVSIIGDAERTWTKPDHGIWEPRIGVRHNVHSKLMNWLAADRGARLALGFGRLDLNARWTELARTIQADVALRGMDASGRHFTSVYGEDRPDATLLLLPIHGFLDDDDPRLVETVAWVRRELGTGHYLHRYRDDDGVRGGEGAFILCGFWLAEALALQGNVDEAREVFAIHADASNHLGLMAEEIDPTDQTLLGNFPQAFSHLGLINAALRIDLALRLRDEGSQRSPHLVGSIPHPR